MKTIAMVLIFTALMTLPAAHAEQETVRFTEDCEFTVTFPGKISTKLNRGSANPSRPWMHVRDIGHLDKYHEISAICQPLDARGREYELLMFYKSMETEARRVRIAKPTIELKQDIKNGFVLGEWKGHTKDYNKKPVAVEGRRLLGRRSKLLLLVATPGTHPASSPLATAFFESIRHK